MNSRPFPSDDAHHAPAAPSLSAARTSRSGREGDPAQRGRPSVQILTCVGLVLLAGGLARVVTGLTGESAAFGAQILADDFDRPAVDGASANEPRAARQDSPASASAPAPTPGEAGLQARFAEARAALDQRARDLDTREKALIVIENRLEEQARLLAQRETALAAQVAAAEEVRAGEFDDLAKAYERMKSRDAARIFETLGDDILVPVAARMRNQSLAGVLAEMSPEAAQMLTRKLALRNTGAPATGRASPGDAGGRQSGPRNTGSGNASLGDNAAGDGNQDAARRSAIGPAQ